MMNDYISRSETIRAITSYPGVVDKSVAKRILLQMPSVNKWTPISERLPNHHRDVLVTGREAFTNNRICRVMCWDVDTWRPCNYAPSIHWDAWMELPEPYDGKLN